MDHIIASVTGILSAVVGLAILTVLVRKESNTTGVIQASASGFSQILSVAMGNNVNGGYSALLNY